MTGGLKYFPNVISKPHRSCTTCGCSLEGKNANAITCSDRCRKIKNGQTKLRRL